MIATLYLLPAIMPFNIEAVQVSTPRNSSNKTDKTNKTGVYDIEYEWANLVDNLSENDVVVLFFIVHNYQYNH